MRWSYLLSLSPSFQAFPPKARAEPFDGVLSQPLQGSCSIRLSLLLEWRPLIRFPGDFSEQGSVGIAHLMSSENSVIFLIGGGGGNLLLGHEHFLFERYNEIAGSSAEALNM
jgi:hypothetical protein